MARTPREVFQHHAEALGSEDIDAIVSDYADDAIFITPEGDRYVRLSGRPDSVQTVRYTLQRT